MKKRCSGILMPVSSLPGGYGIGSMGQAARDFVDFLVLAGQSVWQILPVGPTSYGDSPYQSCSAFAGNPYFIDLDQLAADGLLKPEDYAKENWGTNPNYCDYALLYQKRYKVLRKAYAAFLQQRPVPGYDTPYSDDWYRFTFLSDAWLPDYCLFMAIKNAQNGKCWIDWPEELKDRHSKAVREAEKELEEEIDFYRFQQYCFTTQWRKLKAYANEKGISIIGDVPIYVALDSSDAWANPEMLQFDKDHNPKSVAGCPPDAFSATGQLWGNPLYRWDYHRNTGYQWWISRLSYVFRLYDVVRIDHFRGFDEYFSIPAKDKTAVNGHWEKGPGIELFQVIKARLGEKPIIAEDLGYVTDTVRRMVKESGYPNMKVLEFAFDSRDSSGAGDYLPHNYEHNCVAYTGTHDNETILGWLSSIKPEEVQMVRAYLNRPTESKQVLASELVRTTIASVADTCIIPIQDYLGLDNSARINFPSTLGTNWRWRLIKSDLTKALADSIRKQNIVYGRVKWEDLQEDEKPKDPEEEKETETEPKQKKDSSVKEAKD